MRSREKGEGLFCVQLNVIVYNFELKRKHLKRNGKHIFHSHG